MATRQELLQEEVRELTDLLRNEADFQDLREILTDKGMQVSETVLAGLIGSEDGSQYGVFLTSGIQCIRFETAPNGLLAKWEIINDPNALASDFEAVPAGISMIRNGEIS